MIKKTLFILLLPLLVSLSAEEPMYTQQSSTFQGPKNTREPQITINNCVLAKINGNVISLIDVVKKMDLFLYEYDPNMQLPAAEKAQYYMGRWEETLEEMINNELILLDAAQKEMTISDREVREELEDRFGPNIMKSLEKVNLSFEEASTLIRNELLQRQMTWFKIHSKALQSVTPHIIKEAYQGYLENNPPVENWTYRVLSVRGKNQDACQLIAEQAYTFLSSGEKSLEEVAAELKEKNSEVTITVTEELSGDTPDISKQHYAVIKDLSTQSYSKPVSQVSRFDNSTVSRVFHLESLQEKLPTDFDSMHEPLKNQLLSDIADKERKAYFNGLKKRFGFDQVSPRTPLPENYQPFLLN